MSVTPSYVLEDLLTRQSFHLPDHLLMVKKIQRIAQFIYLPQVQVNTKGAVESSC